MKKIIASLAMVALTGMANAAILAYEPFNYTVGSLANNAAATGTGLTGNWTCGANGTIGTGLSYTALTSANNALSSGSSRQFVSLASPLSSGTKWISFLYKASGNMGGNIDGVFFPNGNATCLWFGFGLGPYSGTAGQLGLGSMTTAGTAAQGATSLKQIGLGTYGSTYLIVLKIDFDTSGANDTVTVYTNPVANAVAPGVLAAGMSSTYDVGIISKVGLNVQGGATITVDEIRVGDTYGEVVGYSVPSPSATNQTTLAISPVIGKQVSWTAQNTNNYQPQKSADNSAWTNLGSVITGSATTSAYDTAFLPYYRVLELTFGGAGVNVMSNGGFEIPAANNAGAADWSSGANTTYETVSVTNHWGTLSPVSGTNLLLMEGSTAAVTPAAPNTYLLSDWFPVSGGLAYNVKFNAANPVKVGGGNPQYRIRFYDAGNAFISEQYRSFAAAGNTWIQFSVTNTAPANAAYLELFFIQAIGAGASWDWVSLIDDVSVNATSSFGPANVLTATVQSGVTFAATVKTNGATAADATGTVAFQTNSIGLTTNGVSAGRATSADTILLPPYTVRAVYSGDSAYIGSTNTLTVNTPAVAVTLAGLSQTYDGTAKSATATTSPSGFTTAFTYNGSPTAPVVVGTYQVIGSVLDSDYQGSATNNLVIAKAAAAVSLGSLLQTNDGTAKSATATTTPAGLPVAFIYNGSVSAPTNAGTYQVIGLVVDNNYYGGATNNLVIVSGVSNTPTNITASVSGNQLTLTWPADHLGWILQSQTNSLSVGIADHWTDVPGSETNTQSVSLVDVANPSVFFRLRSP